MTQSTGVNEETNRARKVRQIAETWQDTYRILSPGTPTWQELSEPARKMIAATVDSLIEEGVIRPGPTVTDALTPVDQAAPWFAPPRGGGSSDGGGRR